MAAFDPAALVTGQPRSISRPGDKERKRVGHRPFVRPRPRIAKAAHRSYSMEPLLARLARWASVLIVASIPPLPRLRFGLVWLGMSSTRELDDVRLGRRVRGRQRLGISHLNVRRFGSRPDRCSQQGIAAARRDPAGMKGSAGDQELRAHAGRQVGPDDSHLATPVRIEQQDFQRIAQVMVIHLVGANPMQADSRVRRDQEIQDAPQRPAARITGRQRAGRNGELTSIAFAHEAAGGVRLEAEQVLDLSCR